MKPVRVTLTVGAVLLCGPHVTSALAGGTATFAIPIVNAQFSASCSDVGVVQSQVTLNGQYHFAVPIIKNPNGTFTTKFQSEAHGTAVDNQGNQYVFNYNNHEQDVSGTPTDLPPILGTFADRFALTSKGGAPNLKVEFQIAFSIDASGNFTLLSLVAKGDPNCDPI